MCSRFRDAAPAVDCIRTVRPRARRFKTFLRLTSVDPSSVVRHLVPALVASP
ncbi:MAG: hypothetical protein ABIT38_06485 [Gemmatimonadaceae bacterium]